MSTTLGDNDYYQNLLQYMNSNNQDSFLNSASLSFSPHEAEKRTLDEMQTDQTDAKRRGKSFISSYVDKTLTVLIESSKSQATDSGSKEPDLKPKKKPGRKLMIAEPANVRFRMVFESDSV
jgi:hypothetical protein